MSPDKRTLVVVATYNEISNLPLLIAEIFAHAPDVDIVVVDDNSPDGTGHWCNRRSAEDPRIHCLHRAGKLGLGTATFAGMRFGLERGYDYIITMDADFSHPPHFLPALRAGMEADEGQEAPDVVIGSRYITGGGIQGWPLYRRGMSWLLNIVARFLLSLSVRDCSGAYRCYRAEILKTIDFNAFYSTGYAYLEEMLLRLREQGARFRETPIVFVDRERGSTKITWREVVATGRVLARLTLRRLGTSTNQERVPKPRF